MRGISIHLEKEAGIMKGLKIGKYGLTIFVYLVVLVWLGIKIWGTPKTTYEKAVHKNDKSYEERIDVENIKYSLEKEYLTQTDYFLLQMKGYEVDVTDGLGKFTVKSILLQSEENSYLVDLVCETLELAPRYAGCQVETDKLAYRAVVPVAILEPGNYQIGFLLSDDTVIWSSERVAAQPYHELVDGNELLVETEKLWYVKDKNYFEGTGGKIGAEIKIINNNDFETIKLLLELTKDQKDAYFVFVCNDVTLSCETKNKKCEAELVFPMKDQGENTIYVYYLSDKNVNMEKENYVLNIADIEFSNEVVDFWGK